MCRFSRHQLIGGEPFGQHTNGLRIAELLSGAARQDDVSKKAIEGSPQLTFMNMNRRPSAVGKYGPALEKHRRARA